MGNTKIAFQAILVVKTLNEGPTLNGINVIKDSLLTVYSQATLRYSAKLTLGAHLPGNGMGGSTKPTAIDAPTISTSGVTACGVNQVGVVIGNCAATGCTAQKAGAPKNEKDFEMPLCCNIAANQPANIATTGIRPKISGIDAGAGMGYVEWNTVGATAEARLKSKNIKGVAPTVAAAVAVNKITQDANAGLTYPKAEQFAQSSTTGIVTAPASGCTNLRANALGVGNSLAWSDISQFPVATAANVASGSVCSAAFKLTTAGAAAAGVANAACTDAGCTSGQRNAAGLSSIATLALADPTLKTAKAAVVLATGAAGEVASTTPYCIGPSVGYLTPYYIGDNWASEPAIAKTADGAKTATVDTGLGYLQLDAIVATSEFQTKSIAGSIGGQYQYQTLRAPTADGGTVLNPANDYTAGITGVQSQGLNPNTIATNNVDTWVKAGVNSGARQNFAYLSSEITAMASAAPTPVGPLTAGNVPVVPATGAANGPFLPARLSPEDVQFAPVRASANGKNMGGEDTFACTDGGNDSGADNVLSGKTGNEAAKNGKEGAIKNQLEGLAFWQIIAGQMAAAKPANVPKDTAGNELTQSKVHENCAANIEAMLTFNTAAVVKNTGSTTIPSQSSVEGNKPNAISFPTWKVAIGSKPTGQDFNYYVAPNGFCYVNQCLTTYLNSVTQDKGASFGKLIKEPNMGAPTAGKNCGQANGACGSIALFRLDNRAPLAYTCSKLGAVGSTAIPEECGTNKWEFAPASAGKVLVIAAGSLYDTAVELQSADGQGSALVGSSIDGVQYLQTAAQETAPVTSWNGQEWPAPSNKDGSPVV